LTTLTSTSSRTEITEAAAIVRARTFVRRCEINAVPVDLKKYLAGANAEMRVSTHLAAGEAGNTMFVGGRHLISVNANDTSERQRFTVLHEIGHIVLGLPSKHGSGVTANALYSYARRPPEEVVCDTFAAECLLPHEFLRRDLKEATALFSYVEGIAARYEASLACTASRVAVNAPFACAYVLSQDGYVRFAAYSLSMRDSGFWITPGIAVPTGSVTGRCLKEDSTGGVGVVPGYLWTSCDAFGNVDVHEDTRIMRTWNQALTLVSLESGDALDERGKDSVPEGNEDESLLRELDGILPWPGGRKHK
jgi:Zn-dependent peptidase ImmA (M78 family)